MRAVLSKLASDSLRRPFLSDTQHQVAEFIMYV